MPGWVADKKKRLAKIREARQALEAEAAVAAAARRLSQILTPSTRYLDARLAIFWTAISAIAFS